MLRYLVAWLLLISAVGALLGAAGVLAFLAQGAIAILMLETINYVEHYGLKLKQLNKDKPKEEPIYESMSR